MIIRLRTFWKSVSNSTVHVCFLLIPNRYWMPCVQLLSLRCITTNTDYIRLCPEFQKAQINNPMVDVELKANTTKAENYRASGNIYGEVDFLKHFTFKAMFSMDYASNNGRTYTPIVKYTMPLSTEGSLLWEQARPRSASLKRMKPKFRATTCWHTPTALIMEIITWQLPPVLLPIIIRWADWRSTQAGGRTGYSG